MNRATPAWRRGLALLFAAAGAVVAAPGQGRADIYALTSPDGVVSFTDAPTSPGYAVIIREGSPPPLHWSEFAHREAERHGLDPGLVRAVIWTESREDPRAVSPKGAQGLMQLMPGTARELGVDDPLRPADNVRGGVRYLAALVDRYPGRLDWALAAYNAGPGAVDRHRGIPPYAETQAYVTRVLDAYRRIRNDRRGAHLVVDTARPVVYIPRPVAERE
ncbi:MAG: lytic transglycosylase domain-containing protein [Deferrisomatales bacterium]